MKIELTRMEAEGIVDILEDCDPSKCGTWRHDLAAEIRELFGMVSLAEETKQILKSLELNDGWTQIPPKKDGEYWMASAKPWHDENAYDLDLLVIVRIKHGKRTAVMERYDEIWMPPDCESPDTPVWDSQSQFEMLAAWRLKREGESFSNPPPAITGIIFERHPVKCPACGQLAAIYRTKHGNPWVCYSCGREGTGDRDYFRRQFRNALMRALQDDMDI